MALNSEITWIELSNILEDLTPTLEKSKQLNKVFLKEFEALQSQKIATISENEAILMKDEELSELDEEYDESLEDNDMIEPHNEEKPQTVAEKTSEICKICDKSY